MYRTTLVAVAALAMASLAHGATPPPAVVSQLPLSFEANRGQEGPTAKFVARGNGYTLLLTPIGVDMQLGDRTSVRMEFERANGSPPISGVDQQPGQVHYFSGSDPDSWITNVPTYAAVHYDNVYPGIDVVYHGQQQKLEYDVVVAPGADPGLVRLKFPGAYKTEIAPNGDLIVKTDAGDLRQQKPVAYQEVAGNRVLVPSNYRILSDGSIGFEVGSYDQRVQLTIDPVLGYGTFLGLAGTSYARDVATDPSGNAIVVGEFNPLGDTLKWDSFITRINAAGTATIYTAYLPGAAALAVASDSSGAAYIAGRTRSPTFPTLHALQSALNGEQDAFVAKLDANGNILFSTYLGGLRSEEAVGIALAPDGGIYVAGDTNSWDFPTSPGAYQRNCTVPPSPQVPTPPPPAPSDLCGSSFVVKMSASGASLVYGTFFGISSLSAKGLAVDSSGRPYITGLIPGLAGNTDAHVSAFTGGLALRYSIRLGGIDHDSGMGIAVDDDGNAYATGWTEGGFPITLGAAQTEYRGFRDAFVTKVSPTGGLVYSTYLASTTGDGGNDIEVDASGNAYVTGTATNTSFPQVDPIPGMLVGGFLTKVAPDGGSFIFSTLLGGVFAVGIDLDSENNAYIATWGETQTLNSIYPRAGFCCTEAFLVKVNGNSDPPPSITVENMFIDEGNSGTRTASFRIRLSRTFASPVFVTATTADGTASAGSDYVHRSQDIVIQPGDSGASFDVTINGDQLDEGVETVLVNLSNAIGAVIATPQGVGTILNDDAATLEFLFEDVLESQAGTTPMTFIVSMSHAKPFAVTVNVQTATSLGTATAGVDYDTKSQVVTIPAGTTGAPFVVTVRGDQVIEPNETIAVSMNGASGGVEIPDNVAYGTIINDDFASPLAGLIEYVEALAVHRIIKAGLLAPLRSANRFLTDQNPRNNRLACPIVTGWIALVDALMDRNVITDVMGNALIQLGRQARFDMGC